MSQTDDVYVKMCDVTACCVDADARVAAGVRACGRRNGQCSRHRVDYGRPRHIGRQWPVDVPRDRRSWTSGFDVTLQSHVATFNDDDVILSVGNIRLDYKYQYNKKPSYCRESRSYCIVWNSSATCYDAFPSTRGNFGSSIVHNMF